MEVPNVKFSGSKYSEPSWFHAGYGRHMNFFDDRSLKLAVEKVGVRNCRTVDNSLSFLMDGSSHSKTCLTSAYE